jgi:hypothetical protein
MFEIGIIDPKIYILSYVQIVLYAKVFLRCSLKFDFSFM